MSAIECYMLGVATTAIIAYIYYRVISKQSDIPAVHQQSLASAPLNLSTITKVRITLIDRDRNEHTVIGDAWSSTWGILQPGKNNMLIEVLDEWASPRESLAMIRMFDAQF